MIEQTQAQQTQAQAPKRPASSVPLLVGGAFFAGIAAFLGWGVWEATHPAPVPLQGMVDARTISVSAKVPGRLAELKVREGDVLIYGRERGKDESFTPVRASGRVTARVWKSASAVLSGTQTQSIRTGRSMQRMVIACPFYRYALQSEPEYLTAETEAERLYPIAAWLPLWVERQTIYEVALEESPRDEQALQHESGRLAMQKLLTFCGGSDEIIDKWLD